MRARGNLIAVVEIVPPEGLTPEERGDIAAIVNARADADPAAAEAK